MRENQIKPFWQIPEPANAGLTKRDRSYQLN
jgi:hypothetical protein